MLSAFVLLLLYNFQFSFGRNDGGFSSISPSTSRLPDDKVATARKWRKHFKKGSQTKYQVLASPGMEKMAKDICAIDPERFLYHKTLWDKFPDGTDKIEIGGYHPFNQIAGQNILMLSSFHSNDVTLSQFSVMVTILQSFVESLTVVLPFYPVGTMERVIQEGQVATANTYAQMLSNLPSCGRPVRFVTYDLHTLQNRFYLHSKAHASLQTTIPLLIERLGLNRDSDSPRMVDCIAFPDEGAAKRFGSMFKGLGVDIITCGKVRIGNDRIVTIKDGNAKDKRVIVVDDLVQTGGTLYECGLALKEAGATEVNCFVAHGVFPNESWKRFTKNGDRGCFSKFFLTNSVPTITSCLPSDDIFEVLDLAQKIIDDLDNFSY
jgi:ribose-phosphate pyrophosphokinase